MSEKLSLLVVDVVTKPIRNQTSQNGHFPTFVSSRPGRLRVLRGMHSLFIINQTEKPDPCSYGALQTKDNEKMDNSWYEINQNSRCHKCSRL